MPEGPLLGRRDLAELWGVTGGRIDEGFSSLHPCVQKCDLITGFASPAGAGVVCGSERYCFECELWYRILAESPPAHAFSILPRVLSASSHSSAATGTKPGWASAPSHSCDGDGCGCHSP